MRKGQKLALMPLIIVAHSVLTAPFAMAIIRLRLNQNDPNLEAPVEGEFARRDVETLSGGQRQCVVLARRAT